MSLIFLVFIGFVYYAALLCNEPSKVTIYGLIALSYRTTERVDVASLMYDIYRLLFTAKQLPI